MREWSCTHVFVGVYKRCGVRENLKKKKKKPLFGVHM